MRKTRIGALVASTALASATILAGAGAANASVGEALGSLDVGGSLQAEAEVVGFAEIVATSNGVVEEGEDPDGAPRYTLSATAYDNCTVEFTLEDQWEEYGGPDHDGLPGWRADYQVGDEDPVMVGSSRGDSTYRPVVGGNQGIADAIANRDNPYDFDANNALVDLTEDRIVPDGDDVSETVIRDGVEPNDDGTHEVTFGVYQGPNTSASGQYSFDTTVTVTGCPITEDEDSSGPLGSLDLFGSLSS